PRSLPARPTRRSSDLLKFPRTLHVTHSFEGAMNVGISSGLPLELGEVSHEALVRASREQVVLHARLAQEHDREDDEEPDVDPDRSEAHTSELQSPDHL